MLKLTREGFGIELRRGPFEILVDRARVGSINRHDTVEEIRGDPSARKAAIVLCL